MNQIAATSSRTIRVLTYLMFMTFAMTTDSVGVIIPQIIRAFQLSMAEGGAFHYATMGGIAIAGLGLGFLADTMGRKRTIILGLGLFSLSSLLFAVSDKFPVFLILLFMSGAAIGIFKAGALALIGDITTSSQGHTRTMNMAEGFFGVGAIIGPALVTGLISLGLPWKWLYMIAGALCMTLTIIATQISYPAPLRAQIKKVTVSRKFEILTNLPVLAASVAAMLYVGVEAAVYVWMPTLLIGYNGVWMLWAANALPGFFVLRATGRFLGAALINRMDWSMVLVICSGAILVCFGAAMAGGANVAVVSLPISGLFMSVMYPIINSKGISCFSSDEHGTVSGIILFFTCVSAVVSPLAMGIVSDRFQNPWFGFGLAVGLCGLLFCLLIVNAITGWFQKQLYSLEADDDRHIQVSH